MSKDILFTTDLGFAQISKRVGLNVPLITEAEAIDLGYAPVSQEELADMTQSYKVREENLARSPLPKPGDVYSTDDPELFELFQRVGLKTNLIE
ncbi:hypothetical protein BH10PAT1_BH10PAT1_4820 [soil metagenome]